MVIRTSFAVLLIFILCIHTSSSINPTYYRPHDEQQEQQHLASLIEAAHKQLDDPYSKSYSSEMNSNNIANDDDDDDQQLIKRQKYPGFRISPLWLSRRTRTNRFYGKPLWISRTG